MRNSRRAGVLLAAALFSTTAAEAQVKYFARARLPRMEANANQSTPTPTSTPTPKSYAGTWFSGGSTSQGACNLGSHTSTVTTNPVCGGGSDGEGGYSQVLADSECDPAQKPAASSQDYWCTSCGGLTTMAKTRFYYDNTAGAGIVTGPSIAASSFNASTLKTTCDNMASSPTSYAAGAQKVKAAYKACQAKLAGSVYQVQYVWSPNPLPTASDASDFAYANCQ